MEEELGAGNKKPEILAKLAQYELTLKDWIEEHRGYRKYVTLTGKCWPAFQTQFGFCAMLCEQPSDSAGHSGILRSGYLRYTQ